MALIDITNQKFGRLTVLFRDKEAESKRKDRHAMWRCVCDCGKEVSVIGKDLRQGKTQSCGCLQKERTSQSNGSNLIGKVFGKLTVVSQAPSKNQRTRWVCSCECGNLVEVCARDLQSGDTNSCGCLFSKGQALIIKLLSNLNYNYKSEYIFEDFPNARFDFAILDDNNQVKCLIEYDGPQHFEKTAQSGGWNNLERYETITHPKDLEKNKYCENKGIPLLRIPFYMYDLLNEETLEREIKNVQGICNLCN